MASSGKTPALNLNQWAATDPVLRDDFNLDNQKVDETVTQLSDTLTACVDSLNTKISSIPKIKYEYGSYTGTGAANTTLYFSPNFTPFMAVMANTRTAYANSNVNTTLFSGCAIAACGTNYSVDNVSFSTGAISFRDPTPTATNSLNYSGNTYAYCAIGVVS